MVAGVPDGAGVDMALVKLPEDALMFPAAPVRGVMDLSTPRSPRAVILAFGRRASKLGFKGLRLHDLRGSHQTALLDAGGPCT